MLHKLRRGTRMLATNAATAEQEGVHHVPFVVKVLTAARTAQATASANLTRETVGELLNLCETAAAHIAKATQQKQEAYRIRAEILGVLDGFSTVGSAEGWVVGSAVGTRVGKPVGLCVQSLWTYS